MERRAFLQHSTWMTGALASSLLLSASRAGASGVEDADAPLGAPYLRRAEPPHSRAAPGMLLNFLARKEDTGGEFALIEGRGVPGMEPQPHVHAREDESVYLLSGGMWVKVGDEEFEMGPGDFLFMPRRVRHQFKVLSDEFHVLLLLTPAGLDDWFWKVTTPVENQEIPPPSTEPPPPEQVAAMLKLLEEYGVTR